MRVIICDLCKKQSDGLINCATITIGESITIGYPDEINLCSACTTRFYNWLRDRAAKEGETP